MNRYRFLVSLTLATVLGNSSAHAALGDKPIEMPGGCTITLDAKPKPTGTSLVALKLKTDDKLQELVANGPIDIVESKYDRMPSQNSKIQDEKAIALGDAISDIILSEEFRGQEDLMIKTSGFLRNNLGFVPDEMLTGITTILQEQLSATRSPKEGGTKTSNPSGNALADMGTEIAKYRKDGLNIDTVSKWAIKFKLKDTGQMMRESFQTVQQVIDKILNTFDVELAKMYLRHEQMKDARLTAKTLERYAQISLAVGAQVQKRCEEFAENAELTADEKNAFLADTLKPLAERMAPITNNRASALTSYTGFRVLMANNQNLIGIFHNLREVAKMDLITNAAMKIIAAEQEENIDLANKATEQLALMRQDTVDSIVRTGIKIMQFPEKVNIPSMDKMADLVDTLLVQISAMADSDTRVSKLYNDATERTNKKLNELKKKSIQGNWLSEIEKSTDGLVQSNVESVPPPPAKLIPVMSGT